MPLDSAPDRERGRAAVGASCIGVAAAPPGPGRGGENEYHCSECGYGVTVRRELPVCPMCDGTTWEQTAWRPFTRALDERLNG